MTESSTREMKPALGLAFRSLLRADATVLLRSYSVLIITLALPILILFVTFHTAQTLGGAGILIGLAIAYGQLSSGLLGYSQTVAKDRDAGVLQRLRVTPVPTWAIMSSRLTVQVAANLVLSTIVIVIGSILYGLRPGPAQYVLALVVSVLSSAVFLALGQALVGLLRSSGLVNAVGRILYILLILVALLGATGVLGSTIKAVSQWTPVSAVMILFAAVLGTSGWDIQALWALLTSIGYIIIFATIGIRWFRWNPDS